VGGGWGVECWASGYAGEDGLIERRMGTETDMDASMKYGKPFGWMGGLFDGLMYQELNLA